MLTFKSNFIFFLSLVASENGMAERTKQGGACVPDCDKKEDNKRFRGRGNFVICQYERIKIYFLTVSNVA